MPRNPLTNKNLSKDGDTRRAGALNSLEQ
ncbi:hypothetical protein DMO17_10705 [Aquipseudomonas alcaligenes]|uniref:2-cysteine adaptor domain-containing protein n=1 Tax=Aquipseudomonas alcaligenes TaxID=43263 RepID=A0A2V4KST8_AQUAC|nr:hypothetical protein DMO17_10705 [Pseudomonas alcaligenes]